jgi:hypothetical protein
MAQVKLECCGTLAQAQSRVAYWTNLGRTAEICSPATAGDVEATVVTLDAGGTATTVCVRNASFVVTVRSDVNCS